MTAVGPQPVVHAARRPVPQHPGAAEALDVTNQLRAIVAALPGDNARDTHQSAQLTGAVTPVDRRTGIT